MTHKTHVIATVLLVLTIIFCSAEVSAQKGQLLPKSQTVLDTPCSPRQLKNQIEQIARVTQGPVGVSIMLLETGEAIHYNGDRKFPMQSVYKFPIAMAVLHQVDAGRLRLEQKISFDKSDFVSEKQHSPIRRKYPDGGELSLKDLLRFAASESDGSASDILLRVLGGPEKVVQYLRKLGIKGLVVETTEKEMGLDETAQYRNSSKPKAMVELLRILHQGKKGLSSSSRNLLLEFMTKTTTGPRRIKGQIPAGTIVAHKTGTSRTVGGITRAMNDVGLVSLPNGKHFAIAVFVSDTTADDQTREEVIAKIARAAWDCYSK
jgi:beta-lactamase class A